MLFDIKLALNKKINSSLTCFILLDKDVTMCGFFVLETQKPWFFGGPGSAYKIWQQTSKVYQCAHLSIKKQNGLSPKLNRDEITITLWNCYPWIAESGFSPAISLNSHFFRYSQYLHYLWCQLEDMFQLIVMLQGIEKVMIQLIDTPTKVYAIGARLFLSKEPLEVLQNWVLI